MKKDEYISISEFAERAGVSKAYIYKAIKDRLQPYYKEVDNQKRLNIKALEFFSSTNMSTISTNNSTDKDTLKELIEILQEQQSTLKNELDIKNEQIRALNNSNSQQLQLIDQQQKLQAISETKRIESKIEPPKPENLLNRGKFSTEVEYSQYLLKLMPRIGMFSSRADRRELEKVFEMMSDYEKSLVYRDKATKEAIEHIQGVDFDKLDQEQNEIENNAKEEKQKLEKLRQQWIKEHEERKADTDILTN